MARIRINIPATVNCPHCQEPNPAAANACQSCGKALLVYIGPAEVLPKRFGLASLMVLVAVIAPCLVVLRAEPALGGLMLLIIVPAMLRTFVAIATCKSDGRPMPNSEKVTTFAASLGIVWLIGAASAIAFGGSYFVMSSILYTMVAGFLDAPPYAIHEPWFLIPTVAVSGIAGVAVAYSLGKRLWRFQK